MEKTDMVANGDGAAANGDGACVAKGDQCAVSESQSAQVADGDAGPKENAQEAGGDAGPKENAQEAGGDAGPKENAQVAGRDAGPKENTQEASPLPSSEEKGKAISKAPASALESRIIKQMEYYFGDVNLMKDKFLLEQMKNDDGWVSMQVIGTFNRMKHLTEDMSVVAQALHKSTSGLLEVSDDQMSVRRSTDRPLPEQNPERKKDLAARTVYAKRFPVESSLDELMEYFAGFGETEQIVMRKNGKKEFKGSVFVLFASREVATDFLERDSIQYNGVNLEVRMTRDDYLVEHAAKMKQFKEEEQKANEKLLAQEKAEKLQSTMVAGAILRVSGLTGTTSRDTIKEFFSKFSPVKWVDMEKDQTEAVIRFESEGSAQAAWNEAKGEEGKVTLDELELEARVLTGEEEMEHWRHIVEQREAARGNKGGRGGRRGGGQFGRGRGRGEKRVSRDGGPSAKRARQ